MDILILDDERDICDIMTLLFVDQGYTIGSAYDPESALKIIKESKPTLLLCDITMPKKTGIEFLEDLKSGGLMIGVVMLTAHAESSMVIQALQLGALDYIVKPFNTPELVKKMPAWLDIGRRLQAIADGPDDAESRMKKQLRMIELLRLKNKRTINQLA